VPSKQACRVHGAECSTGGRATPGTSYRVELAGKPWVLRPDRESAFLLDTFAGIAQLKASEGAGTEILYRSVREDGRFSVRAAGAGFLCNIPAESGLGFIRRLLAPAITDACDRGGFLLHAALVEKDGRGYLLGARSGTGKSTCCQRLPAGWNALSEEEVLVFPAEGGWRAHPLPAWADILERGVGGSWNVGLHLPVSAAFLIRQAGEDAIAEADPPSDGLLFHLLAREKLRKELTDEVFLNGLVARTFENVCSFLDCVSLFVLDVSLTGKFWEKMESATEGKPDRITGDGPR